MCLSAPVSRHPTELTHVSQSQTWSTQPTQRIPTSSSPPPASHPYSDIIRSDDSPAVPPDPSQVSQQGGAQEGEEKGPVPTYTRSVRIEGIQPLILASPEPSLIVPPTPSSFDPDPKLTLVLPLLGTDSFGYDPTRAAGVAATAIASFLDSIKMSHPGAKLVLAGIEADDFPDLVAALPPSRVLFSPHPLTALAKEGILASALAFESNWRFKRGLNGNDRNAEIHTAVGPFLASALKSTHSAGQVGHAYPVSLGAEVAESSPWVAESGLESLIAAIPPNMNPAKRFDACLDGNYAVGDRLLSQTYASVFDAWLLLLDQGTAPPPSPSSLSTVSAAAGAAASSGAAPSTIAPFKGHWKDALTHIAAHPSAYPDAVVYTDADVVVTRDKFPKAEHHYLVLPKAPGFRTLAGVEPTPENQAVIARMVEVAETLASNTLVPSLATPGRERMRIGFHAIPSMNQVHLHVISDDYNSPSLKNKKHWNSFTTSFFISPTTLLDRMASGSAWVLSDEERSQYQGILKGPLRCHRCAVVFPNIPKLKAHVSQHQCTVE